MRDLPTLVWFLCVVVVSIIHRWLPMPTWLLLHLLFLGAATHAILTWSQHFTAALTRSPVTEASRRAQNQRLVLANVAMVAIFVGVPSAMWVLTVVGAVLLSVAVVWHGVSIWLRLRGALPGRFTGIVRYYILSAACLPIGALLGTWIAHPAGASVGLTLAHAIVNVLGWIGITVAGTLVTLWPTMLRTRASGHAAPHAARALPILGGGVLVAAAGAIAALPWLIAAGLAGYLAGLVIIGFSLIREASQASPHSFPTLSAGAAILWWIGCLIALIAGAIRAEITGDGVSLIVMMLHGVAPYFAAGFVTQILIGALSYLVPVVVGGGPQPVRIGTAVFNRAAHLRVSLANTSLLVCALPVTNLTRVVASLVYLGAVASFIPLMLIALRAQSAVKRELKALPEPVPVQHSPEQTRAKHRPGQLIAGLITVLLIVAAGSALDPQARSPIPPIDTTVSASGTGALTAHDAAPVQTVQVDAHDMVFTPNLIEVPSGTHLIVELTNTDAELVHDLVFENGAGGSRLAPGESERIDVGVITHDLSGWCSIIGHRQMGMTLDIVAVGEPPDTDPIATDPTQGTDHEHESPIGESAADLIDLSAQPDADFAPFEARLMPLPEYDEPRTHEITLPVTDRITEVAPGVRQNLWLFGGSGPGPTLHGRVGDTFIITLVNDGSIGHSIDFHAGALAPNEPMRTIAPGETLTYTFTATRAGIWLYHCSTPPMSAHIANGMYGAVVIEPPDLPETDHSYVLVQGEYYLGAQDGEVDMDRLATGHPDLVTFNGYASQYAHAPLTARVSERVRIWVMNAGPNRASSFHVIGGQFDTVWSEGSYRINRAIDTGSQALGLQPAQGGFVELTFPEAGDYPFVSHIMIDAERGANGTFHIDK